MNTQIFTHVHLYSKNFWIAAVVVAITYFAPVANAEWKIDLSRRQKEIRKTDMNDATTYGPTRSPAAVQPMGESPSPVWTGRTQPAEWVPQPAPAPVISGTFDPSEPVTELVILNTPKGFVPNTVRLRKGLRYQVHVVNVNEKEKNISFVLDGFSEHQATYYGKIKSFYLQPTREGVYSFQCPETSIEGRLVVFAPPGAQNLRAPSSEGP